MFAAPLVLDCDASVLPLDDKEIRLDLRDWQERVRFGATWRVFSDFSSCLETRLPENYSVAFTGSGDFHHLSLFLLKHRLKNQPGGSVDLVVCDNHPDNMRYPFGLHCGSWVRRAADIPCIRRIHVIGITSADVGWLHAVENYLSPFWRRKLTYWCVGVGAPWLSLFRRGECARSYESADALLSEFLPVLDASPQVYLSIDKDVLSPNVAQTNWDQGVFGRDHLREVIVGASKKRIGADICGDPSVFDYASPAKRLLSYLDGQAMILPEALHAWRQTHQILNRQLLQWLAQK